MGSSFAKTGGAFFEAVVVVGKLASLMDLFAGGCCNGGDAFGGAGLLKTLLAGNAGGIGFVELEEDVVVGGVGAVGLVCNGRVGAFAFEVVAGASRASASR